jgi:ectoine hydroxylase-related dioxygenase (phytanoyl-CoA dioxygenase family)
MRALESSLIIRAALSDSFLSDLVDFVHKQLMGGRGFSSFLFIDEVSHPLIRKLQQLAEMAVGQPLHYLNDFYLYTDSGAQAEWHIDTEMFSFDKAVNVWVGLDQETKIDPIAFISDVNENDDNYFHSIRRVDDQYEFMNLADFEEKSLSVEVVEDARIRCGDVAKGDVLLINPKRFHRTNSSRPKHAFIVKFVMPGPAGLRSPRAVPAVLWPEVALFDEVIRQADDWPAALATIRSGLADRERRSALTAGFFPERLALFQQKIGELAAQYVAVGHVH